MRTNIVMLPDGLVSGEFIPEPDMFILSQFKSFLKTEQGQKITARSLYLLKKPKTSLRMLNRCQIVIKAATAPSIQHLADTLHLDRNTITRRLKRLMESGWDGMYDKPHSGRPSIFEHLETILLLNGLLHRTPAQYANELDSPLSPLWIARMSCLETMATKRSKAKIPEPGSEEEKALFDEFVLEFKAKTSWNYELLGKAMGLTGKSVHNFMEQHKMKLSTNAPTICVSFDPEYGTKVLDITNLLTRELADNEEVFSLDEKTSIVAHDKDIIDGIYGSCIGSRYIRNGSVDLLAVQSMRTGIVYHKFLEDKTKGSIAGFIQELSERSEFRGKTLHFVLDNLSAHKHFETLVDKDATASTYKDVAIKLRPWYKDFPNIEFHFTPTSSSWMNPVESWFSLLYRFVLKGNSVVWASLDELRNGIETFISFYNQTLAKPCKWSLRIHHHLAQVARTMHNLEEAGYMRACDVLSNINKVLEVLNEQAVMDNTADSELLQKFEKEAASGECYSSFVEFIRKECEKGLTFRHMAVKSCSSTSKNKAEQQEAKESRSDPEQQEALTAKQKSKSTSNCSSKKKKKNDTPKPQFVPRIESLSPVACALLMKLAVKGKSRYAMRYLKHCMCAMKVYKSNRLASLVETQGASVFKS